MVRANTPNPVITSRVMYFYPRWMPAGPTWCLGGYRKRWSVPLDEHCPEVLTMRSKWIGSGIWHDSDIVSGYEGIMDSGNNSWLGLLSPCIIAQVSCTVDKISHLEWPKWVHSVDRAALLLTKLTPFNHCTLLTCLLWDKLTVPLFAFVLCIPLWI